MYQLIFLIAVRPSLSNSGCGEHLVKTLLARECAESLKSPDEPVQSLITCFQNKFVGECNNASARVKLFKRHQSRPTGSPFLRGVNNPMGGALALRATHKESSTTVEFQWIHTTESLSLGFMSTEDAQPQVTKKFQH